MHFCCHTLYALFVQRKVNHVWTHGNFGRKQHKLPALKKCKPKLSNNNCIVLYCIVLYCIVLYCIVITILFQDLT